MTARAVKDSEEADVEEEVVDSQVAAGSLEEECLVAVCQEDSEVAVVGPFNGNPPNAFSY